MAKFGECSFFFQHFSISLILLLRLKLRLLDVGDPATALPKSSRLQDSATPCAYCH
jgi:hypothetical protein